MLRDFSSSGLGIVWKFCNVFSWHNSTIAQLKSKTSRFSTRPNLCTKSSHLSSFQTSFPVLFLSRVVSSPKQFLLFEKFNLSPRKFPFELPILFFFWFQSDCLTNSRNKLKRHKSSLDNKRWKSSGQQIKTDFNKKKINIMNVVF